MTANSVPAGDAGFAEVGERLRAARAKAGMTRRQLALASATSERYLAHLEAGGANPSLGVLSALADALDLAVADLLPLGGERDEPHARAAAELRRLPAERLATLPEWIAEPRREHAGRDSRIVLLGLRGAGKSSLGQALAARLGLPFLEMTREVERAYGGEIGLLIELGGQGALRRCEREAWETIREQHRAAVVAAPGGIIADGPLYDRVLATAHCIWLQASPEDHMARVMKQGDFRPMASNRSAMADLKAILKARTGDYARAAATIDTSAQDFDATVELLCREAVRLVPEHAL